MGAALALSGLRLPPPVFFCRFRGCPVDVEDQRKWQAVATEASRVPAVVRQEHEVERKSVTSTLETSGKDLKSTVCDLTHAQKQQSPKRDTM